MFQEDMKIYHLFISHNGEGDEEYLTFIQRLIEARDFEWEDHGIPGNNGSEDLNKQIEPAEVVIILSGLYARHHDLIQEQVNIAQKLGKPLVLIRPYGMEEVPGELEKIASGVVGWNRVCIVDKILEALEEE
ncbi:TIR domain-containing protein [Methanobacterium formicicum]|uniref:TIR domain-containing protein n=1 Tax=Methanobacterium formicicum TaxID=2162 RepID=UPI00241217C7|nr:TIR domain-containing protein [Methanobacterium formicicum]MDG3547329.1 TIR domain-containing protein [Methanobacterium formicicum]